MLNLNTCAHCGLIHNGVCSRIKSIEYYPNGTIKKIEYHNVNSPPAAVPDPWWQQPWTPPKLPWTICLEG